MDIFPTLTALCGLPTPAQLDGHNLQPQLAQPTTPTAKPALAFWANGQRTIRTDRWRLIASYNAAGEAQFELFDYVNDPAETSNHASAHPEIVRALLTQLARRPELAWPSLRPIQQALPPTATPEA